MAINLSDELHAATTKGKLAAAKEIYLEGDSKNLQQSNDEQDSHLSQHDSEISEAKSRLDNHDTFNQNQTQKNTELDANMKKLNDRDDQITELVKGVTATGGASVATAVSYDNSASKLTAATVQNAVDEIQSKKFDKANVLQSTGQETAKVVSQKVVTDELSKKFDKANVVDELGKSEAQVVSQKVVFDNCTIPTMRFLGGMMEIDTERDEEGNRIYSETIIIRVLKEITFTIDSSRFLFSLNSSLYKIPKGSYSVTLKGNQCVLYWNISTSNFVGYTLSTVVPPGAVRISTMFLQSNLYTYFPIDLTNQKIGIRMFAGKSNWQQFILTGIDSIHIRDIMPDDYENEDLNFYFIICRNIKRIYLDDGEYKSSNGVNINNYVDGQPKELIGGIRDKTIIHYWDFSTNSEKFSSWHYSTRDLLIKNITLYNCTCGHISELETAHYNINIENCVFNITINTPSGYLIYLGNKYIKLNIKDCIFNVAENCNIFSTIFIQKAASLCIEHCTFNGLSETDRSKQKITLPINVEGVKHAIIRHNTVYGGTEGILTRVSKETSLEGFVVENNIVEGTKEESISFDCFGNNVTLNPMICELSIDSAEDIEYSLQGSTNKSLKLYCTARNLKGSHPNETWQEYSLIDNREYVKDFYIFFSSYAGNVFGGTICKCLDVGQDDKGVYVIADIYLDPTKLELSEDKDPKIGTNDSKRTSNFKRASILSGMFAMSVRNNIVRNSKGTGIALFCGIHNSTIDGNLTENCAGGSYLFSSIMLAVGAFNPCCNNKIVNNTFIGGGTSGGETGWGFSFYGYHEKTDMLCYNNIFANNYLNTKELYINHVYNLVLNGNVLDGDTKLRLKDTIVTNVFGTKLPVSPIPGQHFFNMTTKKEMLYDGEKWVETQIASISESE